MSKRRHELILLTANASEHRLVICRLSDFPRLDLASLYRPKKSQEDLGKRMGEIV